MRAVQEVMTDRTPIGYFYDASGRKVDILPSLQFFELHQPNREQLSASLLELLKSGGLDYNSAASDATNFQQLHEKIDILVAFIEAQMQSWKSAGPFAEWDG